MENKYYDEKDNNGNWVLYTNKNKYIKSRSYLSWWGIKTRCKVGGSTQLKQPTYVGCYLSENFKDFQYFASWHTKQIGYRVEGYQLDKDILVHGNKEYGENCCVLIPRQLNSFLCARPRQRGQFPQGISWSKDANALVVHINISSKSTYIGLFNNVKDASAAYKEAKECEARRWYKRLLDREFIVDDRVIERMRTWTFEEIKWQSQK